MSALGHKRTLASELGMSALPLKADMLIVGIMSAKCQKRSSCNSRSQHERCGDTSMPLALRRRRDCTNGPLFTMRSSCSQMAFRSELLQELGAVAVMPKVRNSGSSPSI